MIESVAISGLLRCKRSEKQFRITITDGAVVKNSVAKRLQYTELEETRLTGSKKA